MDVALDIALNASADHPWLTEHPEWFQQRPTARSSTPRTRPSATRTSTTSTGTPTTGSRCGRPGATSSCTGSTAASSVYRVDNPHTKPFPFWEWLIKEVHKVDRDVVFLAEAFTRRAVMRELAKLGFTQSYTYFTWKNSRYEMIEYFNELAWGEEKEYFRPNFFPVTPDILHAYLAARRPAGVRHPARARRDAEPELRHLLGLRALRERAGQRGLRGVPELREVRDHASASSTARCCR